MSCLNAQAYERIGAPKRVIQWIREGVEIPFKEEPSAFELENNVFSTTHEKFVDEEIQKLLLLGYIKKAVNKPVCVHPLKCVPKKNNKLRLVTNCRKLNELIDTPRFSQEGIQAVSDLIKPNDDLFTVDLKDGFHQVPINRRFWKYMGIKWRGVYYVWVVLCFGVSCAPYFFHKTIRPVVTFLRQEHVRIAPFVDDFLSMSQPIVTTDQRDFILQTFQELGWKLNWEKCDLTPKKETVFVGFVVSTDGKRGPWLRVTSDKIKKLRRNIDRCLHKETITARLLARITGQCISMTKAILPGKLLLRNAYRVLKTRTTWDSEVLLTKEAKQDLLRWRSAVAGWNGAPLGHKLVEAQVETDASSWAWGAIYQNLEASGQWTKQVASQHSNYRELLAIFMGLLSFKDLLRGLHVQILSDNVTSVAYLNQLGGPSQEMTMLTTTIWEVARQNGITLTARHLSGVLNGRADRMSRVVSPYEWRLNPRVFRVLDRKWGPHTVDRFASYENRQLERFNSLRWSPESEAIDAMAQNWQGENNFVISPFWMIPRILQLIEQQKCCATIVAPRWPGQHWFSRLQRLSVCRPVRIQNIPRNFWQFKAVPEPQKNPRWKLYAWRVHGDLA